MKEIIYNAIISTFDIKNITNTNGNITFVTIGIDEAKLAKFCKQYNLFCDCEYQSKDITNGLLFNVTYYYLFIDSVCFVIFNIE